jgi:hypothetical protein
MENSLLTGLIIGTCISCLGLIIAAMQSGSSVLGKRTSRTKTLTSPGQAKDIFKIILQSAQSSGYKIAAIDENNYNIVLEEKPSATTWGFFLPISITQEAQGIAQIEIGIKSKLYQLGPIVTRSHERCLNSIKATLLVQKNAVK